MLASATVQGVAESAVGGVSAITGNEAKVTRTDKEGKPEASPIELKLDELINLMKSGGISVYMDKTKVSRAITFTK